MVELKKDFYPRIILISFLLFKNKKSHLAFTNKKHLFSKLKNRCLEEKSKCLIRLFHWIL